MVSATSGREHMRLKALALSVLTLFTIAGAVPPTNAHGDTVADANLLVGNLAPDFELKDLDGKPRHLSDFKKKIIVLEWVNDACPFVQKHYKSGNMQDLQRTYTKKGIVWLCVCSSAPGRPGYHDSA